MQKARRDGTLNPSRLRWTGVPPDTLTKRERQIMAVLYRLARATAREILAAVPGNPSYSTVRTQLRGLERKGHVRHDAVGRVYVYAPVRSRNRARREALQHVIDTFFAGSAQQAAAFLSTWNERSQRRLASRVPQRRLDSSHVTSPAVADL